MYRPPLFPHQAVLLSVSVVNSRVHSRSPGNRYDARREAWKVQRAQRLPALYTNTVVITRSWTKSKSFFGENTLPIVRSWFPILLLNNELKLWPESPLHWIRQNPTNNNKASFSHVGFTKPNPCETHSTFDQFSKSRMCQIYRTRGNCKKLYE